MKPNYKLTDEDTIIGKFDEAVKRHNLISRWGDSVVEITDEERNKRVNVEYKNALKTFKNMLYSPKYGGDEKHLDWALKTALNIKPTKVNARSTYYGRKRF